jgi:hypothetical protein
MRGVAVLDRSNQTAGEFAPNISERWAALHFPQLIGVLCVGMCRDIVIDDHGCLPLGKTFRINPVKVKSANLALRRAIVDRLDQITGLFFC